MALKVDSSFVDNNLGIKVEGELSNIQIVEERSDSEDDDPTADGKSSRTLARVASLSEVSHFPTNLVKPSSTPICGNVAVNNSENVVIGNHTYFNGPVVIKQVIQNAPGLDNPSYAKTEDEETPAQPYKLDTKDNVTKRFHIQKWHKITFSAICLVILGGVFAILSIILSNSNQDNISLSGKEDSVSTSNYTKVVVGLWYDNFHIIIISIALMPLTLMVVSYMLLTLQENGDISINNDSVRVRREPKDIDDDYEPNVKPLTIKDPLVIAPDHLRVVPRSDWLAQPVNESLLETLKHPAPWVIISHTATEGCSSQSECVLRVRVIQTFHIESRGWADIGYNFLVAGDGSAYHGRGWDVVGAHTLGYNRRSIGISFIGTFNTETPPQKQIDACLKLLKRGVTLGKLAKDYKLFAHRQLASTLSPGDKLFDIIGKWPHFVKNVTDADLQ